MNVDNILSKFFDFTDGIRIIMLVHRKKDGGDDKPIKRISRNREEFEEILREFKEIKEKSKIPHRVYSSVNERDYKKAVLNFKINQVNADFNNSKSFYFDIKNRFISSLMRPESRSDRSFMIDLDTKNKDEVEKIDRILAGVVGRNVFKYETKSGFHFITPPFDVRVMEGYEVKKDGLLLLDY